VLPAARRRAARYRGLPARGADAAGPRPLPEPPARAPRGRALVPCTPAPSRPACQAWQAVAVHVTATCQPCHARLVRLCISCALWRASCCACPMWHGELEQADARNVSTIRQATHSAGYTLACTACLDLQSDARQRTALCTVEEQTGVGMTLCLGSPRILVRNALAAGRVASSDRVAAELSGPGGAVITASVAERGRGVYTLFFTVDRAGAWALLPSVRPGPSQQPGLLLQRHVTGVGPGPSAEGA